MQHAGSVKPGLDYLPGADRHGVALQRRKTCLPDLSCAMKQRFERGEMWLGDCLELMADIPSGSVDMILCDLPYGMTACSWDSVLPLDRLWEHYWRVAKPNAAIILTASQPFTSLLITSQLNMFRYTWVWDKVGVTGFANAKKQPLRHLEDVVVFYRSLSTYRPQGLEILNKNRKNNASTGGATLKGVHKSNGRSSLRTVGLERIQEFTNYPKQRLKISRERGLHPTQKPVALFEYLIKTYTDEEQVVLDNCSGSGTTAVAAHRTNRRYICIERDMDYYFQSLDRVAAL